MDKTILMETGSSNERTTTILDVIKDNLEGKRTGLSNVVDTEDSELFYTLSELLEQLPTRDQKRIRVLEPMDFTVLPPSTNTLVSVLIRIESALNDVTMGIQRFRGSFLESYDSDDALQKLDILKGDFALGFDGNLDERKGYLDPDAFAVEQMRIERSRLGVPERFHDLLVQLGNQLLNTPSPLFIQQIHVLDERQIPPYLKLMRSPHILFLITCERKETFRSQSRKRTDKIQSAPERRAVSLTQTIDTPTKKQSDIIESIPLVIKKKRGRI